MAPNARKGLQLASIFDNFPAGTTPGPPFHRRPTSKASATGLTLSASVVEIVTRPCQNRTSFSVTDISQVMGSARFCTAQILKVYKLSAHSNFGLPGLKPLSAASIFRPVLLPPVYTVTLNLAKQNFGHNKFSAKHDQAENSRK